MAEESERRELLNAVVMRNKRNINRYDSEDDEEVEATGKRLRSMVL